MADIPSTELQQFRQRSEELPPRKNNPAALVTISFYPAFIRSNQAPQFVKPLKTGTT
jgi:hypothetical protein